MNTETITSQPPPVTTVYADAQDKTNVCCEVCGHFKSVDVSLLNKKSATLKIKCRCGHTFRNRVEFRKNYRKQVKLAGTYHHPKTGFRSDMVVEDISRDGIGIAVTLHNGLTPGDILVLSFNLDNTRRTEINKKVRVKVVRDGFIGTQFMDVDHYDKELGFYLM